MPIRTGKDARHQPAAKETQKPKKEQQAGQEADTGYGYAEENQKSSSSNPQGYHGLYHVPHKRNQIHLKNTFHHDQTYTV